MSTPRVVYAVFDRFPAPKGAAVHIGAFARALGEAFGPVSLVTVADSAAADRSALSFLPHQLPGVTHVPLPARGADVISRAMTYRRMIAAWWPREPVEVVHVRSIFEGYPVARRKEDLCRYFVYEVNGLPSIELKYHYPGVASDRELLIKLRAQEDACLAASDLVVTVSRVTAAHLISRGVNPGRIKVIANGVDPDLFSWQPPRVYDGGELHLLYSGTMARWQGVDRALEATAAICREVPARITLVGPSTARTRTDLEELAVRLGIRQQVAFRDPLPQHQLVELYRRSHVALAPLLPNDRNIVQGCCPLKVLETMAAGTPLVAGNLPVVTELATNEAEALLVRPGSARSMAEAVLRIARSPELAQRLSRQARLRVEQQFTWERAGRQLVEAYEGLGVERRANKARSASASTPG